MNQTTYRILNDFCRSIGLKQRIPNGGQDIWSSDDDSLSCTSGGGAGFFGGTIIRFASRDGSYGLLLIDGGDASVFDAKQGPDGAHSAVDAVYRAKDYINVILNPPLPDDPNRSAH